MTTEAADSLDDIRSFGSHRGARCDMCKLLAYGTADITETITLALADPTIESKAIWRWLTERKGIDIGYDAVRRHRRGDCLGGKR